MENKNRYNFHDELSYLRLKLRIIEIEQYFKIDLLKKDRSVNVVYLKAIIANEFKNVNHISSGKAFGVRHCNIINLHKIYSRLQKDKKFIMLINAYNNRNIELYHDFCKLHKGKPKVKRNQLDKVQRFTEFNVTMKEAIPILRENKSHYLWNKSFSKWEMKDWKEFERLKQNKLYALVVI